jgi:hypothetical protein
MAPLTELIKEIRFEFPKFELIPKGESKFMKLLNVCLLIITLGQMRTFMTRFTTTIGYRVYIPDTWPSWNWKERAIILRHERVHMRQRQTWGMLRFSLMYLLLPVPVLFANWRTRFEMSAYAESMRASIEYYGADSLDGHHKKWMVWQFIGPSYFWMWVGRKRIERWYNETRMQLTLTVLPPFE